jgi:DNA-binding HxlR family transcriptional regulator
MKRRSYRQYCALAKSLDVVGERWTLLMIREFMIGPRRYRDLLENLPGMGTNLLAARLKDLEAQGLIERTILSEGSRNFAYSLSARGKALEPVIRGLVQWGVEILGAPKEDDLSRPEWDLVAVRMLFRPEQAVKVDGFYVLRADELELFIQVERGRVSLLDRVPTMATSLIIVEGPGAVLKSLILGETSIDDVMNAGTLQIKGSRRQTKRFFGCFRNPQNDPLPVAEVASEAAPVVDSVS